MTASVIARTIAITIEATVIPQRVADPAQHGTGEQVLPTVGHWYFGLVSSELTAIAARTRTTTAEAHRPGSGRGPHGSGAPRPTGRPVVHSRRQLTAGLSSRSSPHRPRCPRR